MRNKYYFIIFVPMLWCSFASSAFLLAERLVRSIALLATTS
jgi:hypothetical protein